MQNVVGPETTPASPSQPHSSSYEMIRINFLKSILKTESSLFALNFFFSLRYPFASVKGYELLHLLMGHVKFSTH